jgi:hypothetical protein
MIETNTNTHALPHLNEEAHEAMQHLQFQMSLLRLTALPNKLRGAEALALRQEASSADLLLEELSLVASNLPQAQ